MQVIGGREGMLHMYIWVQYSDLRCFPDSRAQLLVQPARTCQLSLAHLLESGLEFSVGLVMIGICTREGSGSRDVQTEQEASRFRRNRNASSSNPIWRPPSSWYRSGAVFRSRAPCTAVASFSVQSLLIALLAPHKQRVAGSSQMSRGR